MLKTESKDLPQTSFEMPPKKDWNSGTFGISRAFAELDEFMRAVEGDISSAEAQARYEYLSSKCYENTEDSLYNAYLYDKEVASRIESRKAEIKRLQSLNAIDEEAKSKNRDALHRLLDFIGTTKAKAKHITVSLVRNGGKQPIEYMPELLPEEYAITVKMPDKTKIEAKVKENPAVQIPGVLVKERGVHVQIK